MIIKIATPQTIHELGKRTNQEDALYPGGAQAGASDRVFVVCDGMGGHEKGEVASNTVCEAVAGYLKDRFAPEQLLEDRMLLEAIDYAYQALDSKDDGSPKKMGTTFTFVGLHKGGVTVAYIGDSRIYHIRPRDRRVCMQTRDHSLVYDLYQAGEISFDEMATHPRKNIITKAMQPGGDYRVLPDFVHITDVQPGDYFYLCSDGMLEQMTNDELVDIFAANAADEDKAKRLVEATAGNSDNHTAIFFRVESVTPEPSDGGLFVNDEDTSRSNAVNIKPIVMDVELETTGAGEPVAPAPPVTPSVNPSSYPSAAAPRQPSAPSAPTGVPGGYSGGRQQKSKGINPLYYVAGVVVIAIAAYLLVTALKGSENEKPVSEGVVEVATMVKDDGNASEQADENGQTAQNADGQDSPSAEGVPATFEEYMKNIEDQPIELMGKWYIYQKGVWRQCDSKTKKPGKEVSPKEQDDLNDVMRGKWEKERTAPRKQGAAAHAVSSAESASSAKPPTSEASVDDAADVVNAIDAVKPDASSEPAAAQTPSSKPSNSEQAPSKKGNVEPRVPFSKKK